MKKIVMWKKFICWFGWFLGFFLIGCSTNFSDWIVLKLNMNSENFKLFIGILFVIIGISIEIISMKKFDKLIIEPHDQKEEKVQWKSVPTINKLLVILPIIIGVILGLLLFIKSLMIA